MSSTHDQFLEVRKHLEKSLEQQHETLRECVQTELKRIGNLPRAEVTVAEYEFYQQQRGRF